MVFIRWSISLPIRPGKKVMHRSPRMIVHRRYASHFGRQERMTKGRHFDDLVRQIPNKVTKTSGGVAARQSLEPDEEQDERVARARVVFGSRLTGPHERRRELDNASKRIAGILVPPKPDEPDNCCMSGCVNCVWDRYRDELEEWADKASQAREALKARKVEEASPSKKPSPKRQGVVAEIPAHVAASMDDDGGGSEALWTDSGDLGGDLFQGVPIGIREFMRTEKRLKEKQKKLKQGRAA